MQLNSDGIRRVPARNGFVLFSGFARPFSSGTILFRLTVLGALHSGRTVLVFTWISFCLILLITLSAMIVSEMSWLLNELMVLETDLSTICYNGDNGAFLACHVSL